MYAGTFVSLAYEERVYQLLLSRACRQTGENPPVRSSNERFGGFFWRFSASVTRRTHFRIFEEVDVEVALAGTPEGKPQECNSHTDEPDREHPITSSWV